MKNVALKRREGHQKIPPNFAVTAFVIIFFYCKQLTRMPKTSIPNIQKVQIFPGKHSPWNPYFITHQKAIILTHYKEKRIPIKRFIREKKSSTIANEQSLIEQHYPWVVICHQYEISVLCPKSSNKPSSIKFCFMCFMHKLSCKARFPLTVTFNKI